MMKTIAMHLALAAMVFRVLLPSGWMPSPSVARGIPIVMCTMDGPVKMVMPIDGKPHPVKKSNACPFGAAPHFALAIALLVRDAPSAWVYYDADRSRAPVRVARHYSP